MRFAYRGVPKAAVEKFKARPRKNWSAYKDFSEAKLDRMVRKLEVHSALWSKAHKHQKVCILIGAKQGRFCYFNDTGTGKSFIAIALIDYFARVRSWRVLSGVEPVDLPERKHLILVPNKINKSEWRREYRKHDPQTDVCVLTKSSANKWEQLRSTKARVIIDTYAGFTRMVCRKVPKRGKRKLKLAFDKTLVKELKQIIGGMYLDESSDIGSSKSLQFRLIRQLSNTVDQIFPFNGTPFGRDPLPLWSQVYVVDHGYTLGENKALFYATFYSGKKNFWGGTEFTFKPSKASLLSRYLDNVSICYPINESDLPRVSRISKLFSPAPEVKEYYNKAVLALREKLKAGDKQKSENEFLRLRQLSSGYLGYYDNEEGKRAQIEFKHNRKLELCTSLLQELAPGHKVIVFHDFRFSGAMIGRELKKLGIGYAFLHGGTPDPDGEYNRFLKDDDCRVFVLNSAAGSKGLNLQLVKYTIYYESPVSVRTRIQSERRMVRQGSEHDRVVIYDLVMRNGVDQQILEFHQSGKDMLKSILNGKTKLKLLT